jgi:hypothetical protein
MPPKDEWMNEMKRMHEQQMGGRNSGGPMGGPMMPGGGGPRVSGPMTSLLPPPKDMPGLMRMPGPGGMMEKGMALPIERITALYGDVMNILVSSCSLSFDFFFFGVHSIEHFTYYCIFLFVPFR